MGRAAAWTSAGRAALLLLAFLVHLHPLECPLLLQLALGKDPLRFKLAPGLRAPIVVLHASATLCAQLALFRLDHGDLGKGGQNAAARARGRLVALDFILLRALGSLLLLRFVGLLVALFGPVIRHNTPIKANSESSPGLHHIFSASQTTRRRPHLSEKKSSGRGVEIFSTSTTSTTTTIRETQPH